MDLGDQQVNQAVPGNTQSLYPTGVGCAALPPLSQQQQQQQMNAMFAQMRTSAPGSGQPASCPEISQVPV